MNYAVNKKCICQFKIIHILENLFENNQEFYALLI